ncbi:MAG: exodeoxyribonuclease VII large subunit [Actinomycetota bacterium]
MTETLTVRELCNTVRAAVAEAFPDEVWVKGTISGLTRSANGHVYFDLVEATDDVGGATTDLLPVALFASARNRVNAILRKSGAVRMHDGLEIRIRGAVAYYPPQGRIQLVMSLIDPAHTLGQLALARQALIAELDQEGLLGANAATTLSPVPLRVAVVTSAGSAAHADFVDELRASGHPFVITLYDTRVQGIDAVPSLADGIRRAAADDVDVVAVVRGGGARTDLAAYDNERVARAIATASIPVIVGVGHETDRAVADDVAHTSAKTPTAAAAMLVGVVDAFRARVDDAANRLVRVASAEVMRAEAEVANRSRSLQQATHEAVVAGRQQMVDRGRRLTTAATTSIDRGQFALEERQRRVGRTPAPTLDRAAATLDRLEVALAGHDPARLLARGWSLTHTEAGDLVRTADEVDDGAILVTTTASGQVISTVNQVKLPTPEAGTDAGADQRS